MIKIGLCGLGHLGLSHLKCILQSKFELVGIHDIDTAKGQKIAQEYKTHYYQNYTDLLAAVDAIDVVTSTASHYQLAQAAITLGKHIFIEKPVTSSVDEAKHLLQLQKAHPDILIQVGHIERYNPGLTVIAEHIDAPRFIETHRLAPLQPRGLDVSVIKDLMIHDLDLLLQWIPYPISDIRANGVCLLNDTPDICNARIEFEQGSVCNMTASRVSMKQMRKSRIFQQNGYISIDFGKPEGQFIQFSRSPDEEFKIIIPPIPNTNALLEELLDFHRSILHNRMPLSNLATGYQALDLADQIEQLVIRNNKH